MRVAMIGAGLQANRRGPVIAAARGHELTVVAAAQIEHAQAFAASYGATVVPTWQEAVTRDDVDAVIVATPPDSHRDITVAALRAGKHVLCEKPLARTMPEAEEMVLVAEETGLVLKCGFNHRYHPAIAQARTLVTSGELGEPIFARGKYGIIGRPGLEQEWRSDPKVVSGGQMMEQGIHLVDLFRWMLGDFAHASGFVSTTYWPIAPLEDNGFGLLQRADGVTASFHSSLTQWRNLFSLEVYCRDGYAQVEGLGGGYGTEQLIVGRKDFNGPFSQQVTDFRGGDVSWRVEWEEFAAAVEQGRAPDGDGRDGLEAMRLVNAIYASSASAGRPVEV